MEVEAFQYDGDTHNMENIETLKDFFRLLRVKSLSHQHFDNRQQQISREMTQDILTRLSSA